MFKRYTGRARRELKKLALSLTEADLEQRMAAERPQASEYGLDPFGFDLDWAIAGSAPLL